MRSPICSKDRLRPCRSCLGPLARQAGAEAGAGGSSVTTRASQVDRASHDRRPEVPRVDLHVPKCPLSSEAPGSSASPARARPLQSGHKYLPDDEHEPRSPSRPRPRRRPSGRVPPGLRGTDRSASRNRAHPAREAVRGQGPSSGPAGAPKHTCPGMSHAYLATVSLLTPQPAGDLRPGTPVPVHPP